jgi:cephalosporin hydroxylase
MARFRSDSLPAMERPFKSDIPSSVLSDIQSGVMRTVYRGIPFYKSPFDIALYLQLMSKQRPQTVIEIGTKFGGSALWFADMLSAHGVEIPKVISVDIEPVVEITDERIVFLRGNARNLGKVLTAELLSACRRPLLVVEDSSHYYEESIATLEFFHQYLKSGDYVVVEDGVVSQLPEPVYARYAGGPNRAVAEFLEEHSDQYEIDTALCDHFGFNATYNPNAWLKRR